MMLLAIDTSADEASVALMDDSTLLGENTWLARRNHSRTLTPAIRRLMSICGQPATSLTAVVVSAGPGSFSGLRVGISEAKGIAMARGIPLTGINSMDVIAFQSLYASDELWVVLPAGRGEYVVGAYRSDGDSASAAGERFLGTASFCADRIPAGALLVGSGASGLGAELGVIRHHVRTRPGVFEQRRAGFLAELGRRYFSTGGIDQLFELEPIYLRRSAAEERRDSDAQE